MPPAPVCRCLGSPVSVTCLHSAMRAPEFRVGMVQVEEQEPSQNSVLTCSGVPADIREGCIVANPLLESHPAATVPGSGRAVAGP
eukprot:1873390-Rhodomonas_salina.2